MTAIAATAMKEGVDLKRTYKKVALHLLPFLFICYLFNYLVGWIKDATHSTDLALYILAALMFIGVALVLRIPGTIVNR